MAIIDMKDWHRLHARKQREEAARNRPDAGNHAASRFMQAIDPGPDACVAVYYPVGTELDTWPLVEALAVNGNAITLPVVVAKKQPLIFRLYEIDQPLVPGRYGIKVPPPGAEELEPDVIICPLLGFTRDGTRLGMGGGYYDRTLQAIRARRHVLAVGYAFGGQEMTQIPRERHDEPLDWIVTEREAFRPG